MHRGMFSICVCLAMLTSACDFPRDPETTIARIEDRGTIRLGIIQGAVLSDTAKQQLDAQAERLRARILTESDEGEALFKKLEQGELDLVYGHLSASSPWRSRVYLGRVPGRSEQPPADASAPRFAFRNGENGWIMAMERSRP